MNHTLQITVDNKNRNRGIVTCRSVSVRERQPDKADGHCAGRFGGRNRN